MLQCELAPAEEKAQVEGPISGGSGKKQIGKRLAVLLGESVTRGNFRQGKHDPRVRYHRIWPTLFCGFLEQVEILLSHFHVDLNVSFHALLYLTLLKESQRY